MCLIIHKPVGKKLPEGLVRQAFRDNPDGAGFTTLANKKRTSRKGFFTIDSLLIALRDSKALEKHAETVLHCRIASVGAVSGANCHPHHIANIGLLFHNGTLSKLGGKDCSDTAHLAQVLGKLSLADVRALLSEISGYLNKFALVRGVNVERFGNWEEHKGLWLSHKLYDRVFSFVQTPTSYVWPKDMLSNHADDSLASRDCRNCQLNSCADCNVYKFNNYCN